MYDYLPHELLLKVHNTSRPLAGGGHASNVFNVDFDTDDGKDYLAGAFGRSIAIWAFAGVFGLIILLSLIGGVFCNRRFRKKRYGGKTGIRKWIGPRCVYLLMLLGMIASSIVAMAHGPSYIAGITDGLKGIQTIGNAFVDSSDATVDVVQVELASIDADLDAALDVVTDAGLEDTLDDLSNMSAAFMGTMDTFADRLGKLSDVWNRDFLNADIEDYDPKINWEDAKSGLSKSLYAVGAITVIWLVFHALGLFANKCSAIYFRATTLVTVLVAVLIMTLCGFALAIGFIGSDFCVDHTNAIDHLLSIIDTEPIVRTSVSYYARCPHSGTTDGLLDELSILQGDMTMYIGELNGALDDATTLGETGVAAELDNALAKAALIEQTLDEMFDTMDCPVIGVAMDQSLDGLCNSMIVGDLRVTMALGAAGVFFIPLLFAVVSLCCRHPGDSLIAPPGEIVEATATKNPQNVSQAWVPHSTPISTAPVRHAGSSMV